MTRSPLELITQTLAAIFLATSVNAEAVTYLCVFDMFSNPDGLQKAEGFQIEFSLDTLTNEAFMKGNSGVSRIQPVTGSESVTFVEPLSSGTVQTTTITFLGEAVHSRHTIIAGDLFPSQYYGSCERQ